MNERKPPYMVPASLMQIDAIPLNQNGKVNRKALPEPVIAAAEEDTGHVDNALETELKKMIGEVLNTENPPLNTPLEYLGLNSIGMIRLSTKLGKRFGAERCTDRNLYRLHETARKHIVQYPVDDHI